MNKVFLIGNLTRDPEVRTTATGKNLCSFSIAVNRRRAAEGQPSVDYFTVTAWQQLGDLCARYLAKGRKVCVSGAVQLRQYTASDGSTRNAVDIVADEVEFLSPASSSQMPVSAAAQPQEPEGYMQVDEDELPF